MQIATTDFINRIVEENEDLREYLCQIMEYSKETHSHCVKTAEIVCGMARIEGISGDKLKDITMGALLHDIGKTTWDRSLITKVGKLRPEEWEIIHTHPERGAQIIGMQFGKIVYDMIYCHHENLIGSGYPLQITDLPDYVQMINVADKYEAITSKRNYKEEYNHACALAHLYDGCAKGELNIRYVNMIAQGYNLGTSGWNFLADFFNNNPRCVDTGKLENLFPEDICTAPANVSP